MQASTRHMAQVRGALRPGLRSSGGGGARRGAAGGAAALGLPADAELGDELGLRARAAAADGRRRAAARAPPPADPVPSRLAKTYARLSANLTACGEAETCGKPHPWRRINRPVEADHCTGGNTDHCTRIPTKNSSSMRCADRAAPRMTDTAVPVMDSPGSPWTQTPCAAPIGLVGGAAAPRRPLAAARDARRLDVRLPRRARRQRPQALPRHAPRAVRRLLAAVHQPARHTKRGPRPRRPPAEQQARF